MSCIWLLPFYPSPGRDNGYEITDYLGIHSDLGDLGDFAAFMDEAANRGIRVIIDLVVNHTSDQHPWFRAVQSRDPHYFDYYVWRKDRPGDTGNEVVFPGKQSDTSADSAGHRLSEFRGSRTIFSVWCSQPK